MAEHRAIEFKEQSVNLDDNSYYDCKFEKCRIVYSGGGVPKLERNHFDSCEWIFDGAAERTLSYMASLYAGGGDSLIEMIFNAIRNPTVVSHGK